MGWPAALAIGAGALFGSKGGGGGQQTTSSSPWKPQQPYLKDLFEMAGGTEGKWTGGPEYILKPTGSRGGGGSFGIGRTGGRLGSFERVKNPNRRWVEGKKGLVDTPLQAYGGPWVAGSNPALTKSRGMISSMASGDNPWSTDAVSLASDTLQGKFLSPESNPWLKSYYDEAAENFVPGFDSSAIKAGRYGSGAWGAQRGKALGTMASKIYGGAYDTERNRQMGTLSMIPSIADASYKDALMLEALGQDIRSEEQSEIDAAKAVHDFEQMEPWQRAQLYQGLITGNYGGVSAQNVFGPSKTDRMIGGALTGLGAYSKYKDLF